MRTITIAIAVATTIASATTSNNVQAQADAHAKQIVAEAMQDQHKAVRKTERKVKRNPYLAAYDRAIKSLNK